MGRRPAVGPLSAPAPAATGTPLAVAPLPGELRVAAGVAGAAAVWASGGGGLLTAPAVVLLLVLHVTAVVVGVLVEVPRPARRAASWLVLGAAVLTVVLGGGVVGGSALAVLAGGLVVSQHVLLHRPRDVGVSLVTIGGTAVLVLSRDPGATAVAALVVSWVAAAATVALLRRPANVATGRPAPDLGPTARRLVWPVAASLVAAAVVGLVGITPPSVAPPQDLSRLGPLSTAGPGGGAGGSSGGAGGAGSGGSGAVPRSAADDQSATLDMNERGELPTWPVMRVPATSDRLWRTGVLTTYDGRAWSPFQAPPMASGPQDPLGLGDVDTEGGALVASARVRTDRVTDLGGLRGGLALPGHAVAVRADAEVFRPASWGTLAVAGGTAAYEVDSLAVPDATVARDVVGSDPAGDLWTWLPDTVTTRTRELAEEVTRGAGTRAEVVAAVEQHLRTSYGYDLDSPVPPDGQDAVDHFLFDARVGFCQQFAAAEVVMLRSLGVPARMAVGYSGGRDVGDGRREVTADRSHAWVEVWQPGTGWAPSDPTPAAEAPGAAESLADWFADPGHRRVLAVVLVLLFALAAGTALLVRRRARPEPAPAPVPDPLIDAVERLLPALERAGRPSAPHETVAALARREPELAGALAVAERAAYGPSAPRWREAAEARDRLDDYSARLRAEADRRDGVRTR